MLGKEGRDTHGGQNRGVEDQFGHGQERRPIVLSFGHKVSEEGFDCLVCPFRLPVGPRMPSCGRGWSYPKEPLDLGPELGNKDRTSIGDNLIRKAMQTDEAV